MRLGTLSTLLVLAATACGGGSAEPATTTPRRGPPVVRHTVTPVVPPAPQESIAEAPAVQETRALDQPVQQAEPPQPQALARAPQRLPAPPFTKRLASGPSPVRSARLLRVSDQPNQITDDDVWFQQNGLPRPALRPQRGVMPAELSVYPAQYAGRRLIRAVRRPDHTILFYGPNFGGGPILAVLDTQGAMLASFDFADWANPTTGRVGQYTDMWPQYAQVQDSVLYVTHSHRTYAASSGGRNAYLSAIDLATGRLLWRTPPLVSNVASFAIVGDVIVTGYGFTDEKDYMFVLDRTTGRTLHRLRVASGPDHVIEHQGRIHVRTYDHDYVFELQVRAAR